VGNLFLFKPRRGDLSVARGATPGKATPIKLIFSPVGAAYRSRRVQPGDSTPETPIREKETSRHRAGNQEYKETNTQPSSLTTPDQPPLQSAQIRGQNYSTSIPAAPTGRNPYMGVGTVPGVDTPGYLHVAPTGLKTRMLRATPQPPTHALQSVKIRPQSAGTALFLFN
jgi:hypothetical protein